LFTCVLVIFSACTSSDKDIPLALYKNLLIGEVFPSNNVYIYRFVKSDPEETKGVSSFQFYLMTNNPNPAKIEVRSAEYHDYYKNIKFDKLEPGLSGFFSLFDNYGDFVQYKVNGQIKKNTLIFSLLKYEVNRVVPLQGSRTPNKQEVSRASKWLTAWYKHYEKIYGFPYSEERDQIGRPDTILNAQRIVAFHIDQSEISAQISKWNTHSISYHGKICFIVDVFRKNKQVLSFDKCYSYGAL